MKSKISAILIFLICLPAFAQNELKVISSGRNSIVLQYTPSFTDTSYIKINNEKYLKINLKQGSYLNPDDWGAPAVPRRILTLGVPSEYGNTIQVLNYSSKEWNVKLSPKPQMVKDKDLNSFVYKLNENYYNYKDKKELVSFGEYGIARGLPVQQIIISPVSYNASEGIIKLYTGITFQINYSPNQQSSASSVDNFLSGSVLNYNVARNWIRGREKGKLRKGIVNSVLSTGKWVKFDVPEEGIYRITRSMLPSFGIDPAAVDPRTIKIYNNGGKMLPENVNAEYPEDLEENAIIVVGEDDGKFDEGDYILFYGRGIDFWDYDTTQDKITRNFNLYSKNNYYFITSGGLPGKRIAKEASLHGGAAAQNSTQAFSDWEVDSVNIFSSGRYFLGAEFSEVKTSNTFTEKLDGRISNTPINYSFRIVNKVKSTIGIEVYENSAVGGSVRLLSQSIGGFGNDDYTFGIEYNGNASYMGDLQDNRSVLKFQVNSSESGTLAYLDFFEISYQKQLKAFNDYLEFYSKDTTSALEYDLTGFSNSIIQVFNVTDFANVKMIDNPVLLSGGEYKFQENETKGKVSKYIAVGNGQYKTPEHPIAIENQNLHGITGGAKYIIITDKLFKEQANSLKTYRESQAKDKLSSIVVYTDQIYNEYSGGALDVSGIRNFIKYAYDNWTIQPEYVLLFGDGTYDYKNIEKNNNNFIPTYQNYDTSKYSLKTIKYDEIYSYPTDDYYAMVDGNVNGKNDNLIDLAIGRLPIQSVNDARIVVDKIINYENGTDKDLWRNLITLVADDGPAGPGVDDGNIHTNQSEILANQKIPNSFNINKIYLAAYPTVLTGDGRTKPGVNEAIIAAINQGTLIMNYFGHGAPELWAHERVWVDATTIPRLHNNRYFFLTAATCDFAHYDLTTVQSGAEQLILKENSGAIGAFSAARPVYSPDNSRLANSFYSYLLKSKDSSNFPMSLGKVYTLTKDDNPDPNSQKYGLLGDPALHLLIPQYNAEIDSVNGKSFLPGSASVQIKALSNTRIDGIIEKQDNTAWDDFNGIGIVTVYDSERKLSLPQLSNYVMTLQGGTIFRGKVSITNGRFSSSFVVPKDISYQNQNGKIIVYFYNDAVDGLGYTDKIIVGGTDSSVVNDGKGPDIQIYFDAANANTSYLITPNSKLLVKLTDATGINTTGTGIGHGLEGILNDNINNPIDFKDYFSGDINSGGKSGMITYPFNDIAPGDYKIEVKAWDVFNNFSLKTANFTVVSGDKLEISNVYNYPNPFAWNTTFTFQQNLNSVLDLKIKIYTVAGRLIRDIERTGVEEQYVTVPWDGRDEDGNVIANGTYFYKLIVKTTDGRYSTNILGKLAVIR